MAIWQKTNPNQLMNQQNQLNHAQGQQAMGGGGLGSGYVGGSYIGTGVNQSTDPEKVALRQENYRLHTEIQSFDSIRAQDRVLLQRHYRIWQWLKDVHPEVIEEFKAVEDLLEASGETF